MRSIFMNSVGFGYHSLYSIDWDFSAELYYSTFGKLRPVMMLFCLVAFHFFLFCFVFCLFVFLSFHFFLVKQKRKAQDNLLN